LARLPGKLFGVFEILVLAASAFSEDRAVRINAVRGWFDDGDEICFAEVGVVPVDAGLDFLARQGELDHDDPTVDSGNALSHVGQRIDTEF